MSTSPDNGSGGGSEKTKMEINQNFVDEARKGNLSCIELLLSDDGSGVDINHKSKGRSQSALNAASLNGHENVVKFLLSHNCDIHTKDSKGATPLISATLSGHREVVRLLLEAGADADTPTNFPNQYTAITMAYSKGFSEILSLLINSERNKKESCHKFQNSLCYGIGKKYDDLIPLLVAAGANANTVFDDGSNLVTQAISSKNYSTLGVLLSCGATINDTTLNDADSEGQTLLIKCAETGADIAVDYLIKTGADIEKKDSKGMTALMKASEKGHVNVVSLLLQSGAQWKGIKNKDGYNANDLANKNKHEEASDLLKLFGFSKWGDQARFNHVLINAASRSHDGVCAKILDKGMFVDVTNEEGKTGLHSAAEAGHMSTVQLFLERGADSSLISKVGLSPMQYSLKFGHYQIAAKLLDAKSKTPGLLKSALSRINDFYEYLNHDCFDKDAFGNSEDQLYEKLPLSQIHSEELLTLEDKKCEEEEDSDVEDDVNRSEPSIIETIVKFGSEKDKKMCLEVLVLANEKKYGDTNPDRTEQKVIEKLRGIFHHPDLAFTVRYVKSLFPIGSVTFMLSSGILFITNIIVGFGNYCLDIGTDIHYTESLFSEDFDENSTVTVINSNETILAVPTSNGFFIAGVISAIHVGLSIFMSIVFFLSMECRQFSRESLHKIPLPFVTKTYGFYLEYQKLSQLRKKRGKLRDKEVRKWTKKILSHSDWINISLMIEASFESAFQFIFQSIFALPTTLGLMRGAGKIDDFLTIQNFSILTSFLSFSWACVTIR